MSWLWPVAFGLGLVLFLALMNVLTRLVLVRIFDTPQAARAFVRDRARRITRRAS